MHAQSHRSIEDAPVNAFHWRMSVYVTGGLFLDGYILGVIGIAMALAPSSFGLTEIWQGLIGASSLIGLLFGGIIFGWVTDLLGRKKLYTLDLLIFLLCSIAQFFVTSPAQLFLVRLVMGLAIGADYAIAPAMLAEFMPKRLRGPLLASLAFIWTVGFTLAYAVGYLTSGAGGEAWRWLLASGAAPCAVVLLLRLGSPESPRWLISRGRINEARDVVTKHIGADYGIDDLLVDKGIKPRYQMLFTRKWGGRAVFAGTIWAAMAWPNFAVFTFLPGLLTQLGVRDQYLNTLVIMLFFVVGAAIGLPLMNRVGRRRPLVLSLAGMALTALILGLVSHPPTSIALAVFALFSVLLGIGSDLEFVYPGELFPTELRASGSGMAAAISRFGAAGGTFIMPSILVNLGAPAAMLATAAVLVIGTAVGLRWAPETVGLTLNESSRGDVNTSTRRPASGSSTRATP